MVLCPLKGSKLLHILHGGDDYSIINELDAIKQSIMDPEMLITNTVTLEGDTVTEDDLRTACETVPFLADKRMVIVHSLLERFSPHQTGRGTTKTSEKSLLTTKSLVKLLKTYQEVPFLS